MKTITMPTRKTIERVATEVFGSAFEELPLRNRLALIRDIHDLDQEECTLTFYEAAKILSERIGGANALKGYTQCLVVDRRK